MSAAADALAAARALLEHITPLTGDCGRLCGAACCDSLPGEREETGMLLFPGEAALYEGAEGFRVEEAPAGELLICSGRCERAERPLSCRMFPLLPVLREDGIHAVRDERARAVCPLWRAGKSGLLPEFVEAVRQAGEALRQDPRQEAFLQRLTDEQKEWKRLRQEWGGGNHVDPGRNQP